MTDERERTDPEQAGRVVNMIVGLFLSCFGLFMIVLGGGCGMLLLGSAFGPVGDGMGPFLLLAIGVAIAGGFALHHGVRMISGKR